MKKEEISCLIQNVIETAKYNKKRKKYIIREEDYSHLNESEMKILKKICYELNIELEEIIQYIENEELFNEYNHIMNELTKENISQKEKKSLINKKIIIRNKILLDNIPAFNKLINRRITNINTPEELEEIQQLGYILILEYMDENYLYKGQFKKALSEIIMMRLKRLSTIKQEGISIRQKEYLEKIKEINLPIESISIKKIESKLNVNQNKANSILNLMNLQTPCSIEQMINSNNLPSNDYFEKYIDIQSKKEIIDKIIKLLPLNYQRIISLYFGLNKNESYNIIQIAKMTNLTKQRVNYIINTSLNYLRSAIIINNLKEISGKKIKEPFITPTNPKLETNLIKNLPLNCHQELLKLLPNEIYKTFYNLYFIDQYSIEEISYKMHLSSKQTNNLKYKVLIIIKEKIQSKTKNTPTSEYHQYLEYLMNIYLSNESSKQKRKILN